MRTILARKVIPRNPFKVSELPLLVRLYMRASEGVSSGGSSRRSVARRWFQSFYNLSRRLPIDIRGVAQFTNENLGRTDLIRFNAKNTQFHSLYFHAYAGGYERWLLALLDWLTPNDGIFVDAGSNWGYFALYLASRRGFHGKTLCLEPFPTTYQDLVDTVRQCGLEDFVQTIKAGLSDESGEGKMVIPGVDSGAATLVAGSLPGARDVRLVTLDDVCKEVGMSRLDFVKYDVEGSETRALQGSAEVLKRYKPMVVFESWKYGKDFSKTLRPFHLLEEMGYCIFLPAWQFEFLSRPVFLEQEGNLSKQATCLALLPFRWEERYAYGLRLNFFACHEEKLSLLSS